MKFDVYALQRKYGRPEVLSDPFQDNTPASLQGLLQVLELASVDYDLLHSAYELVRQHGVGKNSPTYWNDTLSEIGFAES